MLPNVNQPLQGLPAMLHISVTPNEIVFLSMKGMTRRSVPSIGMGSPIEKIGANYLRTVPHNYAVCGASFFGNPHAPVSAC